MVSLERLTKVHIRTDARNVYKQSQQTRAHTHKHTPIPSHKVGCRQLLFSSYISTPRVISACVFPRGGAQMVLLGTSHIRTRDHKCVTA
ncbi:unnamed protein product [Ectocarpus sp. 12 AP-2014]